MKSNQKLSLQDAQEIRRQLNLGVSGYRLAKIYGVSQMAISKIKRRLTHKEPITPVVTRARISGKDEYA